MTEGQAIENSVTEEQIEKLVQKELYHVFEGTTHTICCLILRNGFSVVGESACVAADNYDQLMGENIAYNNAIEKVWELEGYRLKQTMHENDEFKENLAREMVGPIKSDY